MTIFKNIYTELFVYTPRNPVYSIAHWLDTNTYLLYLQLRLRDMNEKNINP